jgi:hypothetical protein
VIVMTNCGGFPTVKELATRLDDDLAALAE